MAASITFPILSLGMRLLARGFIACGSPPTITSPADHRMASFAELIDQLADCSSPSESLELEDQLRSTFERECALLALDMSGYSVSVRRGGILPHLCRIRCMQRLVAPIVTAHGGEVIRQIADNIMAVFAEPAAAIHAAVAMNKAVAVPSVCGDEPGKNSPLEVGIGIDYGRMFVVPGEDCFGDPVNIAYKLGEDVARAGEILITESARTRVMSEAREPTQVSYSFEPLELSVSGIEIPAFKLLHKPAPQT